MKTHPHTETEADKVVRHLKRHQLSDVEEIFAYFLEHRRQASESWDIYCRDEYYDLQVLERNAQYKDWFEVLAISAEVLWEFGWSIEEIFAHPELNNSGNWDRFPALMHFASKFKRYREFPLWYYQAEEWEGEEEEIEP